MTILLIALLPAVAVLLIAIRSKSKSATIIAALFAGAIGLLSGNPSYAALDVVAVVGATLLALQTVEFRQAPPPVAKVLESEVVKSSANKTNSEGRFTWLVIAIAAGAFFWNLASSDVQRQTPVPQPAQATFTPPAQNNQKQFQANPAAAKSMNKGAPKVKSNTTPQPTSREYGRERRISGKEPDGGHAYRKTVNCEYKGVMSDQDYINCGIEPPRP